MKKTKTNTPTSVDYLVQEAIEQIVAPIPKGTDLALCDVMSAMLSGYFVESGGGIMPAVDGYLKEKVPDEKERAARCRRAAKAVTHGQYNLPELVERLQEMVAAEGHWQPTKVQGYRLKPVDMTSYKRSRVKGLASKAYDSAAGRAVPAVSYGLMGTSGRVGGQRLALLEMVLCGQVDVNKPASEMARVYKEVAKRLQADEIAIFDAGFSLVEAVAHGIDHCVVRLAKNCTFGKTPGKVPPRTSKKGPAPSRPQAEILRPLARQHGKRVLAGSQPAQSFTIHDESGRAVRIEVWPKLYFLERQLDRFEDAALKKQLRGKPIQLIAIHHPDFDDPMLLGTPLLTLTPQSMLAIYPERWPIEGIPQSGKYLLSGGGGRHYVHHPTAMQRLPALSMLFGSLAKYLAATCPPFRSGFWDRAAKPTYGRLLKHLKKVGVPLSRQLSKKRSVTAHLPVGYEAIRLAKA